jgi:hypothetical protein
VAGGRKRRRGVTVGLVAALLLAVAVGVGLGWERDPAVSSPTTGNGTPIVAGVASSVTASTLPTTSATSTSIGPSTTATTGTTTTTLPAAPANLAVSPARVDLGATGVTATLTLGNGGEKPLSWTAATSVPWLRVSPASGRLDGGERASVSVSASRDGLPEGDADGTVALDWDGPTRAVPVALSVERPPEIGGLAASPAQIRVPPCAPASTTVRATVSDESGLASVMLQVGRQQTPMTQRGSSWFATLGPVQSAGTVPWQVVATDTRGNTATASGPAVTVLPCP